MARTRTALRWAGVLIGAAAAGLLAASVFVERRYRPRIVSPEQAPTVPVALVFGAGLAARDEPSAVLAERIDAAVSLYRSRKVRKVLVSGDNSERYHDETRAMRRYAVERGMPEEDVISDWAGLSTYDSCFRAKALFGVNRAILVTQDFHLPRALFIANSLGIDADGVAADAGREESSYAVRELFSRPWALLMVLARPSPKYVEKDPAH